MNRTFKIVFNRSRGKLMVVNEATRSVAGGKSGAAKAVVLSATLLSAAVFASAPRNSYRPFHEAGGMDSSNI